MGKTNCCVFPVCLSCSAGVCPGNDCWSPGQEYWADLGEGQLEVVFVICCIVRLGRTGRQGGEAANDILWQRWA